MTPQPILHPRNLKRLHISDHPIANPMSTLSPMQATAWLAGETITDHPTAVCPLLAQVFRQWATLISEMDRDALIRPLLPKLVGTNQGRTIADIRAHMVTNFLTQTYIPHLLELAGAPESTRDFRTTPDSSPDSPLDTDLLQQTVNTTLRRIDPLPVAPLEPPAYGLRLPDAVHHTAFEALADAALPTNIGTVIGDLPHRILSTVAYATTQNFGQILDPLYDQLSQFVDKLVKVRYRPSGKYY